MPNHKKSDEKKIRDRRKKMDKRKDKRIESFKKKKIEKIKETVELVKLKKQVEDSTRKINGLKAQLWSRNPPPQLHATTNERNSHGPCTRTSTPNMCKKGVSGYHRSGLGTVSVSQPCFLKKSNEVPNLPTTTKLSKDVIETLLVDGQQVLLGRGSFGCVSLGKMKYLCTVVAIKELLAPNDSLDELVREARIMQLLLQSPFFPYVYGTMDTRSSLVMEFVGEEFVEGAVTRYRSRTLHDFLSGTLQENDRQHLPKMCLNIAEGIEFMHKKGILHNDLKENNVLLGVCHQEVGYFPKICDFGKATSVQNPKVYNIKQGTKKHGIYDKYRHLAHELRNFQGQGSQKPTAMDKLKHCIECNEEFPTRSFQRHKYKCYDFEKRTWKAHDANSVEGHQQPGSSRTSDLRYNHIDDVNSSDSEVDSVVVDDIVMEDLDEAAYMSDASTDVQEEVVMSSATNDDDGNNPGKPDWSDMESELDENDPVDTDGDTDAEDNPDIEAVDSDDEEDFRLQGKPVASKVTQLRKVAASAIRFSLVV
ncbi:uncharacterized protein LOC135489949 [Lineus longissimus]|uniref:uncharacterized protein LOC135489949 n=1 Tax=Lineus longissimus TaxID=88925 RepID=UPI00315D46B4